jgi:hypothetical protein
MGTYIGTPGASACLACQPGWFTNMEGSTACISDCSRAPCSAYANCTDTTPPGNGYSCTCLGCYRGDGLKPPSLTPSTDGCTLPPFPGFDPGIAAYPGSTPFKAGDSIRFKFSFGCNTGPDIFRSPYPRFTLLPRGTSCVLLAATPTAGGAQPANVAEAAAFAEYAPLPPRSWSWDGKALEYAFKAGTDKAWAGRCVLLDLGFKQDGWHMEDAADARAAFQL